MRSLGDFSGSILSPEPGPQPTMATALQGDVLQPGARVALHLIGAIHRKVEGIFLHEEDDHAVVAINFSAVQHVEGKVQCSVENAQGQAVALFFVRVPIVSVLTRVPRNWGDNFTPVVRAGTPVPKLSALMREHQSVTDVESEVDLRGGPQAQQRRARIQGAPEDDRVLGAGLIGRRVARIARLYDQADVEGAEDDELETNGESDDGLLDGEPERGRRRVRHPRQKDDGMDRIMRALEKGADPNTLMNMEMFRMMKEMRDEDRRRRTRTEECDSDSGEELRARTALGKAVAGMNRHKRRVSERPKAIIKEFKANVMEELGITSPKEPWRYVDTHRRITWGQYRTPQRAYILMMHVMQRLDDGKPLGAQAMAIQSAKAFHQCSADLGNWKVAWAYFGVVDPLARKKWAGTARELGVMADWIKAEEEVEKKARTSLKNNVSDGEEKPDKTPKNKLEDKGDKGLDKGKDCKDGKDV